MPKKDLKEHVTMQCPWRAVQCDHCHELHPECQVKVTKPCKTIIPFFCDYLSKTCLLIKIVKRTTNINREFLSARQRRFVQVGHATVYGLILQVCFASA